MPVLIIVVVALCAVQVSAHHSFGAAYLENQRVTIDGQLVQLQFRNPHSFIHVMVREKDGSVVRYAVEWAGAYELGGQGINRETFKIGDRLIISGNPGRNKRDHLLRMITLTRPKDGLTSVSPPPF